MNRFYITDCGIVRTQNEDEVGIIENSSNQFLVFVSDGLGGHLAGDVASRMVKDYLNDQWVKSDSFHTLQEIEHWLQVHIPAINQEIAFVAKKDKKYQGMGTTLVLGIFTNNHVVIANIGDSRAYLVRNHEIIQLTTDHNYLNEVLLSGEVEIENALSHPRKNHLTKSLGVEGVCDFDVITMDLNANDVYLFCSDGLFKKVSDEEIALAIKENIDFESAGKYLVQLANDRGGEDNISIALFQWTEVKSR